MKKIQFKLISSLLLLAFTVAGLFAQNTNQPFADFYVSTTGNDAWSGKLAEPNIGKTDGPFATVNRAKQAVRLIKKGLLP